MQQGASEASLPACMPVVDPGVYKWGGGGGECGRREGGNFGISSCEISVLHQFLSVQAYISC